MEPGQLQKTSCSAFAILKRLIIIEEGGVGFHFALGRVDYVARSECVCSLSCLTPYSFFRCNRVIGASVRGLDLPLTSWVTYDSSLDLSLPVCRMGIMVALVQRQ